MDWNWVYLALALGTAGLTAKFQKRHWVAVGLHIGALLALVGAWPTAPLRWMWLAFTLVGGGLLVLWETHTRAHHESKVTRLRSHEREGRTLGLLLTLVLSFGAPPNKPRTNYWPHVSEWLDVARNMVREMGGLRYVDIFNDTAAVVVELPSPIASNMTHERQHYELLSRHLHQFRQIIHEVELGR